MVSGKNITMQLSKANLSAIVLDQASAYDGLVNLPEKVLQFGTGVLLRALPDYFIDKANKQGIFNGRILVVKSTQSDSSAFDSQDGLFSICARGIQNGMPVEENSINASIKEKIHNSSAPLHCCS
jgi:tagaturonate reductase